jgi:ATP-binding cassette subfamily B protein
MARYVTASRLVANIAVAGLVLWGADQVAAGGVELGIFAAVVLNLRRLYDEPLRLGGVVHAYQSASASLRAIATVLTRQPTVDEPAHPARLPARPAGQPGRPVQFEQVSFAYHPGTTVLPGLNLAIPAGQTVAVVGATGSGKSTLVKLVARLYDPVGGRILVDGVDLRDLPTGELHRTVVMMPQDAFLFTATIADNIALGRPGVSRSDIEGAATAVGAQAGRTALIVAHRPSTIRIADRVLVMSGGHIVEDGTSDQLFGTRTAKSPGRCGPGSSKS